MTKMPLVFFLLYSSWLSSWGSPGPVVSWLVPREGFRPVMCLRPYSGSLSQLLWPLLVLQAPHPQLELQDWFLVQNTRWVSCLSWFCPDAQDSKLSTLIWYERAFQKWCDEADPAREALGHDRCRWSQAKQQVRGCLGNCLNDSFTELGDRTFPLSFPLSLLYFIPLPPCLPPSAFQQVIPNSGCKALESHWEDEI